MDDDIDIFSNDQFDSALSTRFQADRDIVVMSGARAYPLDPSLFDRRTGAKAGFDLTIPHGVDRGLAYRVADPPDLKPGGKQSVSEALKDRPLRFSEIMEATGSRDGREVIVELEMLRDAGKLSRLDDGRNALAE